MIKIYEEKVFWVLLSLLCFVLLILGSVKLCQMISERYSTARVSRIVIIGEEGVITVVDPLRDTENQADLITVKQSYKNLAPPLYATLSKARAYSTYELPPPYPIDHI